MSFLPRIKSAALHALTASGATDFLRAFNHDATVVFMLHRFTDPDRGVVGDDPDRVRRLLAYLRRKRYDLVPLEAVFQSLAGERAALRNAIAFTIDDGYQEQATIAGPLFAEFDCPVTTFVTTGFLDQTVWFWWDRIDYIFRHTGIASVTVESDSGRLQYALDGAPSRESAKTAFTTVCKSLAEGRKQELIRRLAAAARVVVPERAPAEYAPMTWDQLRACERSGMTFGPHTVTHPILTRVDDDRAADEIVTSWKRLQAEATAPVPVFAYPNGQLADFGEREFEVLRRTGLRAVTGVETFATPARYRGPNGPLLVPRFPFPDAFPHLVQRVGGLERLKAVLRGET